MATDSTTRTLAMSGRDAVIVDTVRTPRGRGRPLGASKPGAYAGFHPQGPAAHVLHAVVERNALPPDDLDDVILGCVTQVDDQSANIARHAVLAAGLPVSVPGTTVTHACGSGLQALSYAIMGVMTGALSVVEVGGPEPSRMDKLIRTALTAKGDPREVITDPTARYYGALLSERTPLPGDDAQLGDTTYHDWRKQSAAPSTR